MVTATRNRTLGLGMVHEIGTGVPTNTAEQLLVNGDPTTDLRDLRCASAAAGAQSDTGVSIRAVSIAPVQFASGGAAVEAILYRCQAQGNDAPALVISTGADRNIKGLEWLSLPLAQRGYMVLTQHYREGETRFHLRDEEDIQNAISYLEQVSDVDARRVGIVGHSRGGSAVLRAAAKDARVRSTVAMNAPTDYARWTRGIQHYAPGEYRSAITRYGATPDDDPHYYQAISPITYAGRIKTPVLLVQGGNDLRTPADHAQWMYDALVEAGNPRVRLEVLPGLGHAFEADGGYGFEKVVALVHQWFADTL
ncbi:MAG TPA: prolyl oligopeptidase family serine peptidase [bacterium]|nr:prolyl oligopeptidase family serine peptidase [bacterium]